MRSNFDALTLPPGAALSAPIERTQPEARTERWMQQLERAALAGGAPAKGAGRTLAAPSAPQLAAAAAAPAHHAENVCARLTAAAGADPLALMPHAQAAYAVHSSGAATAKGAHAGALIATVAQKATAAPGASSPALPPSNVPATLSVAAQIALARLQNAVPGALDAAPAGAAPALETPPAGEQYARSLLHVVRGDDGVHAWLRDASLSDVQVRKVALAVAGELAQSGAPLAELTVNGKKINWSGATGVTGGRDAAAHPDEAAFAAQPLTQFAVKGA